MKKSQIEYVVARSPEHTITQEQYDRFRNLRKTDVTYTIIMASICNILRERYPGQDIYTQDVKEFVLRHFS